MGLSLANVSNDLKNYAFDHQEDIVEKVAEIGLAGIPGSPVKGLEDYVNIITCDGIQERVLHSMTTVDPLQPGGRGSFNPKEYGTLGTRKVRSEAIKTDIIFTEDKILSYYNTYLYRVSRGKFDPEQVPFESWLIERLMQDIQKYLRMAFYKSVKYTTHAPTNNSNDLFDGILHQVADIVTATPGVITEVELNAITQANIIAEFEKFKAHIPTNIRYGDKSVMLISQAHYDMYLAAYRNDFSSLTYNTGFEKVTLDGTGIELAVEPGLEEFELPIVTTKENLALMVDLERMGTLDFDYAKRDRSIAMLLDFYAGAGIAKPEEVWIGTVE